MFCDQMRLRCSVKKMLSFCKDVRGVAAVEFAMILPLMLTLYLGTVEISQGVAVDRKVAIVARTLGDLVSQSTSINNADMSNVMAASFGVMAPYPTTTLQVIISEVSIDSNAVAKIVWSDAQNTTARTVGSTVSIPTALKVKSTNLIWAEAKYVYTPVIGYVVTGGLNLTSENFVRPRQSNDVQRVP